MSDMSIEHLNTAASKCYEFIRTNTDSPMAATFTCMMVMYHIWSLNRTPPFEEWHTFVSAQLAQIHLDNTPTETRN